MTIKIDLAKVEEHNVGIKIIEFTLSDNKEEIVRSVNIMILKKQKFIVISNETFGQSQSLTNSFNSFVASNISAKI